jgi:hypothetical protein
MDQKLILKVLLYRLQINKLMGNKISRSWTKTSTKSIGAMYKSTS